MTSLDTIYALSSGRLPSGVALVRVSGPGTRSVVETIVGTAIDPRRASYRAFRSPDGSIIDRGLVTVFPAPHSFTGEDCAEFGLHGGKAVVACMLDALSRIEGLRQAEAGEFTRRAMLNGRLDLVETEALADLISAETEAQRRFALANAEGRQSVLYADWRRRIVYGRAMLEAELDFSDESDVPGSVAGDVWADMERLTQEIETHAAGFRSAEIIRDGFRVVILGAPNVGKSSLLNALARRDAAIVSEEPGTTRDLVEVVMELSGVKVVITDTAGVRENAGTVEAIGIERALTAARSADLVLAACVVDAPDGGTSDLCGAPVLRVGTKVDLVSPQARELMMRQFDFVVSSVSCDGIGALLSAISERASGAIGDLGDVLPSRARHVELLTECVSGLRSAGEDDDGPLELRAEMLRQAGDALGRIVGAVDVEDLLDVIFSEFCIGK